MKKEWGLLEKILDGRKRIESRWYINKVAPWDQIKPADAVYFKNSGEPVTARATVEKVIQISDLDKPTFQKPLFPENEGVVSVGGIDIETVLDLFAGDDGIEVDQVPYYLEQFKNKRYCVLVFLKDVQKVEPFNINKAGFGAMSAWISVDDVEIIKLTPDV